MLTAYCLFANPIKFFVYLSVLSAFAVTFYALGGCRPWREWEEFGDNPKPRQGSIPLHPLFPRSSVVRHRPICYTISMCGIAGIYNTNGQPPSELVLRQMAGAFSIAGRTARFHFDGGLGLAQGTCGLSTFQMRRCSR